MLVHKPVIKPYKDIQFKLVEEYIYGDIKIPAGYNTDGASIPRIFWSFYPPFKSEYFSACLIHDYLCSRAIHSKSYSEALIKYLEADRIFLEVLKELNVSKKTQFIFYNFVKYKHIINTKLKLYKLKD